MPDTPQQPLITPELLDAIAQVESGGDQYAVSPAGARGTYQFMPIGWQDVQQNNPNLSQYSYNEFVYDPKVSRIFAQKLLELNAKRIGESADLDTILAAYNFGIGNVKKKKKYPKETIEYIDKIKKELKKRAK